MRFSRNLLTEQQYEDGFYDDPFGSDFSYLQQVVAPPPAPAPAPFVAPAPAPFVVPVAAPAPTPAFVPEVSELPDFSDMVNPFTGERFGDIDVAAAQKQLEENQAREAALAALTGQITSQWQQYGIDPNIKGINRANELAQILTNYGITDLSKLGLTEATPYQETFEYAGSDIAPSESVVRDYTRRQLTYGDKTFGKLGGFGSKGQQEFSDPLEYLAPAHEGSNRYGLAYSAAGKGWTDYEVIPGPGGKPIIVPKWGSSSDVTPELVQFLALAAMPFTGGLSSSLGTALGSKVAGQIASQALISGGLGGLSAAAQGGSFGEGFGKGALTGGLTAGVGSLVAPAASAVGSSVLNATDSQLLADVASGAVKGGAGALPSALMTGDFGNVLTDAVSGGVGSGVNSALGSVLPDEITGNVNVDNALIKGAQSLASAATKAALTGQDIDPTAVLQPAVTQYISDEYKLPPAQVNAGLNIATKLLQGGDLSPFDILRLGTAFGSSGAKAPAGQAASAGYGGADIGDFFDSEEAQAVQDDIQSLLTRYPEAAPEPAPAPAPEPVSAPASAPAPYFPEFEEPFPVYTPEPAEQRVEVTAPAPAPQPIEDFISSIVAQEPAPYFPEFEQPLLTAEPAEQRYEVTAPAPAPFYELPEAPVMQDLYQPPGAIEGPSTIETIGAKPPEAPVLPLEDIPAIVAPPVEPPTIPPPAAAPAPAPTPAAAPSPAPSPAPAPAAPPAPKGMDPAAWAMIFAALAAGEEEAKRDPYRTAEIDTTSPFGTIFDMYRG